MRMKFLVTETGCPHLSIHQQDGSARRCWRPVRKVLVSVGVPSFSVRLLTSFGPLTLLSALAEAKLEAVCEQDVRSCLFSLRSIANL